MSYPPQAWTRVHTHAGDPQGGQLDVDNIFSDLVHSHESAGEGGTLADAALPGLATHEGLATIHQDAPGLITTHEALDTIHQDAPGLITTHEALDTIHQDAPALIATHAVLTTGVHGAGSDYLALFGQEGQLVNKVIWRTTTSFSLNTITSSTIGVTDLDLSSQVSAAAKYAILHLSLQTISWSASQAYLQVQQKGEAGSAVSEVYAQWEADNLNKAYSIMKMDVNMKIRYTVVIVGTANVQARITVMGYIE